VQATEVVPADTTFSSAVALDLGDRLVELVHPGRGHTAGDLVVRVPDADVLAAGDLVEQSDPPFIGGDSWPFEWPTTMDLVLGFLGDSTVVVPGHGVAFCHGLHHVAGRLRTGQQVDMWWRATQGLRLMDGKWRIVHEHSSLPFDMASGKVSFDLQP